MSLKFGVTVSFEIESLTPLDKDTVANRVGELLNPSDSDNWFESADDNALFDEDSLTISVTEAVEA
jgi:hypothetical protein